MFVVTSRRINVHGIPCLECSSLLRLSSQFIGYDEGPITRDGASAPADNRRQRAVGAHEFGLVGRPSVESRLRRSRALQWCRSWAVPWEINSDGSEVDRRAANSVDEVRGQAGPSTLTVGTPWPARTTTMWLSASLGFDSRWMAPAGTWTKSPATASTTASPPVPDSIRSRPETT